MRALGRFVDAGWQDLRTMHDSRGPCSEKRPFLARSSRGAFPKGGLRGFSDAWRAYPAKASSFRMHGARILPRTGDFPVRDHFWDAWSAKLATDCRPGTHRARILPLPVRPRAHQGAVPPPSDAGERISRAFCHRRTLVNAPRRNIAMADNAPRDKRRRAFCSPSFAFLFTARVSIGAFSVGSRRHSAVSLIEAHIR